LVIAGYPLENIAPHASFEELVYLLWRGVLPTSAQLTEFAAAMGAQRAISKTTIDVLREAAAKKLHAMDALRMGASTLSLYNPCDDAGGNPPVDALSAVARFPTIVAAYYRLCKGQEPVAPRSDLGHTANYLYMIFGTEPRPEQVRACETYLNTVSDHGLNASTFTCRVITSTRSDVISAVVGAIGALKGPLHGGAPGPALDMVFEIGTLENAEPWLRKKLSADERLMGFGHRVYKVRDPRADVLSAAAAKLFEGGDENGLYKLALGVEQVCLRLLEEYKPGRKLQTNVEYYTALVLHGLGMPTDLFTPTFAVGRVAGWTAHYFEQLKESKIIRPQSIFDGPQDKTWVPAESR
jgi:citrate synthase